jgi:bifunctional DNase/RNase
MGEEVTVAMRVDTIVVDPTSEMPVLVLRGEEQPELYLPIFIGQLEAASIASVLAGVELPRPMSHDLMLTLVEKLDGRLLHVTITGLRSNTFYAELTVEGADGALRSVDARPSDSIALAIRVDAPIYVTESVLASAGGISEPADNGGIRMVSKERTPVEEELAPPIGQDTRLEDLEPELFGKYKM